MHCKLSSRLPVVVLVAWVVVCASVQSSAQPIRGPATAAVPARFIGEFVVTDGATRFTRCAGGESHAVATGGDYLALERAYRRSRPDAGQPRVVVLEGSFEKREVRDRGIQPVLLVERSVGVLRDRSCRESLADSPVEDTSWLILSLNGGTLQGTEGKREPRIRFFRERGSFRATVGCNTLGGEYALEGSALSLLNGPRTRMACPAPVTDREQRFLRDIVKVVRIRVTGPTAELLGPDGESLALLEDVPIPPLKDSEGQPQASK